MKYRVTVSYWTDKFRRVTFVTSQTDERKLILEAKKIVAEELGLDAFGAREFVVLKKEQEHEQ